jgi:signal transduction histidine kinase/FixJ family two-component response regulator
MNIRLHTGLLLAVCTASGLSIGGYVMHGFRRVETSLHAVGPNSATLKDLKLLHTAVAQWRNEIEAVLDAEEAPATLDALAAPLLETATALQRSALASNEESRNLLLTIRAEVESSRRLATTAAAEQGAAQVAAVALARADLEPVLRRLVDATRGVQHQLQVASELQKIDLEEQRAELLLSSWAATCAYVLVVGIAWYWTTRTLALPIAALSKAAELANGTDRRFELDERGPTEVRQLTRNISTFVTALQHQKQRTEQEVLDRTRQLVHANQAKSAFLATMSHELRTPLNGILNMNELLLGTELDAEQQEFARTAKNGAEALLALINDVLDFSKIEAQKLTLETVPFRLRDLVDAAIEILAGVAEQKGLELGAVVAHTVPDALVGDPTRIRQILLNLLNNALKFTEQGRVELRVDGRAEGDALRLRFAVIDTGIGIPPSRVNGLFQAFEQVDASTTRKYGGTGLGLAICRELSELMGGDIRVDSELGRGSTFRFEIVVRSDAETAAIRPLPANLEAAVHILSHRPLAGDRLEQQLLLLGLQPAQLHRHDPRHDAAELAARCAAPPGLVLVDGNGLEPARLETLLAALATCPRLIVFESALRRRSGQGHRLPPGAQIAPEPVRLDRLLHLLAGTQPAMSGTSALPMAKRALRVLVAEDNPINQRVAKLMLQKVGHDVLLVENGEQALAQLQQRVFDVVLMDCQMPVLDGWQATARIRALERTGRLPAGPGSHVPIVALTANAFEGERDRCLAAGMDEFLSKPFRPQQVLDVIDQVLARAGSPHGTAARDG